MPHSPYYFRRGVHISLLCPPSTCVCMCAVNAGRCVIDLFVQDWASTSSLLCLVTGNNYANTDNSHVSTSPFWYTPVSGMGEREAGDKNLPQILSYFSDVPPRPVIEVRWGYCFTPYDTLGIRRTYSRLKPPAPPRGAGNRTRVANVIGHRPSRILVMRTSHYSVV